MIILENLTAGYTHEPVLKEINWHIRKGEHWVVTGDMGSGKTTLLQALEGKVRKLHGRIQYGFLKNPLTYEERKASIRMVSFTDDSKLFHNASAIHYYQQRYQAFDSDGHLTVKGYLEAGGLDLTDPAHRQFLELMDLWPLLSLERIKLSSGQTRKILLCKAFLTRPKLLLLDNPHIGLDDQSRQLFNDYIDNLVKNFDQQIILSGYFRSLPQCMTHQLHLNQGRIESQDIIAGRKTEDKPDRLIHAPSENLKAHFRNANEAGFRTMLKFDQINISYQEKSIFRQLDWMVNKGEKWVVQGPNGSGKSTLISLIYGDHPQAYSNKIILFDRQRGTGESIWDIKKQIGFTSPELQSYYNYNQPASDVVLSGIWDSFFVQKREQKSQQLVHLLFGYFDLTSKLQAPFQTLSTGMQRLLFFMRALIKTPPVLLLDEPYQGLDNHIIKKCNLLLNHTLTDQHTLIFISHFPDEVPALVGKKLVLNG